MKTLLIIILVVIVIGIVLYAVARYFTIDQQVDSDLLVKAHEGATEEMVVAGGCFWCVEADMEKVPGVIAAVSGYSGGESENPTYGTYADGGHREVAKIIYDPTVVTYRQLLTYFMKHIDPTDAGGQFVDRGVQYSPAIYFATEEEKQIAEEVIEDIRSRGVLEDDINIPVVPKETFWEAEEYHQDYYLKHPIKYNFYRSRSGRSDFIEQHWGDDASSLPEKMEGVASGGSSGVWQEYEKPSDEVLREQLSEVQYKVTQEDGTERPFENEYWDTTEEGIYVDILSGEPLFSSVNKFKSGTGWPSFSKPLEPENIVTKEDRSLLFTRTEIRSRYGDNHIGHVFEDGPQSAGQLEGVEKEHQPEEYTGLRYCMNSAALRFIPKDRLKKEGYGKYVSLFE